MTARSLPPTGQAAAENELLAQLGLPPSAAPEDVDQLHLAVSEYLAAAPSSIRGWAHAQATALDAAYLQLTDPVGFGGSALKSPTRPPRVEPGGPATPPARRGSLPVASPRPSGNPGAIDAEADAEDFAALYASVTPSAHEDMGPDRRKSAFGRTSTARTLPSAPSDGSRRKVAIGGLGVALVVGIAFAGYALGGGGSGSPSAQQSPAASDVLSVDPAVIASLMQKLQANPRDAETLLALADQYYQAKQFETAATWLDKLLAIDGNNVKALLARGAVSYNIGDLTAAEGTWTKVATLDPKNTEVHYDLGFLYLNQTTPDWAGVQREWSKVIELDPASDLAKNAKAHLDALAAKSMLPGASGAPSTAPSASPAASPAASAKP